MINGLNLIGKATLNVLEPGGRQEMTAVEEKRFHVCHEHMSFKQEVVRLGQFGIGEERLNASGSHVSFADARCIICEKHNSLFASCQRRYCTFGRP